MLGKTEVGQEKNTIGKSKLKRVASKNPAGTSVAARQRNRNTFLVLHVPDKIKIKYFQSLGKNYSRPHDPAR